MESTQQVIRRGIIMSFDNATYTATVQILEATSFALTSVPIAHQTDGTSAIAGASCAVLFFDIANPSDAVILAIYPNNTYVPALPPGRVTFTTGFRQINAQTITSGNTSTYTLSGGSIPGGALGVVFKAYFTSATVGAYVEIAPHGKTITDYVTMGNIQVANQFVNGGGLVQVDSALKVDIKANGGNCTVTLYTHGYVA